MLQKISLAIFLIFSLTACGVGPKVTVCISDPVNHGFQCFDQRTKKSFFLDYSKSENYFALSPSDAKDVLNYCKQKGTK